MICVDLYYNQDTLYRFRLSGHAGYAEHGSDIVCSAVSILVINTINAIEQFSDEKLSIDAMHQEKGIIDCSFPNRKKGNTTEEATILLDTLVLGLDSVKQMYGEYIEIKIKK